MVYENVGSAVLHKDYICISMAQGRKPPQKKALGQTSTEFIDQRNNIAVVYSKEILTRNNIAVVYRKEILTRNNIAVVNRKEILTRNNIPVV